MVALQPYHRRSHFQRFFVIARITRVEGEPACAVATLGHAGTPQVHVSSCIQSLSSPSSPNPFPQPTRSFCRQLEHSNFYFWFAPTSTLEPNLHFSRLQLPKRRLQLQLPSSSLQLRASNFQLGNSNLQLRVPIANFGVATSTLNTQAPTPSCRGFNE